MKLTFKARYQSLQDLPDTTLPAFTLITGINGAGKSHLLRAIETGAVAVDIAPDHRNDIKYFDWGNLHPNDAGEVVTAALYQERDQVLSHVANARQQHGPALNQLVASNKALRKWGRDPWALGRLGHEQWRNLIPNEAERSATLEQLGQIFSRASDLVVHGAKQNQLAIADEVPAIAASVRSSIGGFPVLLQEDDFRGRHIGFGKTDLFRQSFAQLFLAYFELQKVNRLYRLEAADGREPAETPLDDTAFRATHGEPPWDFVNQILIDARLSFRIDHPREWTTTRYVPKLTKLGSGAEVQFSALSSGEKVLMSFALSLYYSSDKRQLVQRPKLLLLDEVDAPLHPSMCRTLLDVVTRTLVEREGIAVIMTTHSPSTVAVAPEASLFAMTPNVPGVLPISKNKAISVLTAELPMLSVSFDGRRQVFVESALDAQRYDKLFENLRPELPHERSLVFIGAGSRTPAGDRDAGCAQVKRIVEQLTEAGNKSVFGLLDWDLKHSPTDRIHVLAAGERYAIENCLLDPLLLGALVVREDRSRSGARLGLDPAETYQHLGAFDTARLQTLSDRVQELVLGRPPSGQQTVRYVGGFSIGVDPAFLTKQGHALETDAKAAFPLLNRFVREGDLLMRIVEPVVVEQRRFVPEVLVRALRDLLDAEV